MEMQVIFNRTSIMFVFPYKEHSPILQVCEQYHNSFVHRTMGSDLTWGKNETFRARRQLQHALVRKLKNDTIYTDQMFSNWITDKLHIK